MFVLVEVVKKEIPTASLVLNKYPAYLPTAHNSPLDFDNLFLWRFDLAPCPNLLLTLILPIAHSIISSISAMWAPPLTPCVALGNSVSNCLVFLLNVLIDFFLVSFSILKEGCLFRSARVISLLSSYICINTGHIYR